MKSVVFIIATFISLGFASAEEIHDPALITDGYKFYKQHAYDITLAICNPKSPILSLVGMPISVEKETELAKLFGAAITDTLNWESGEEINRPQSNSAVKDAVVRFNSYMSFNFPATRFSPEIVGLLTSEGYKRALNECYGNWDILKVAFENKLVVADAVAKALMIAGPVEAVNGIGYLGTKLLQLKTLMNSSELGPWVTKYAGPFIKYTPAPVAKTMQALATDSPFRFLLGGSAFGLVGMWIGSKFENTKAGAIIGFVLGGAGGVKFGWWKGVLPSTATLATFFGVEQAAAKLQNDKSAASQNVERQNSMQTLIDNYKADVKKFEAERAQTQDANKIKDLDHRIVGLNATIKALESDVNKLPRP